MRSRRRMPVPMEITAIVELDDDETLEDAELRASEVMRRLQALITDACLACSSARAHGDKCDWHRVRFVVGRVGRSLFARGAAS